MNLGKNILDLRKKKNVTQEEMAAELGITAAAVSKWENGYTLPDILMLCALADFFHVTTDELLGRNRKQKFAVIAAETMALGQKIAQAANRHGLTVHGIYEQFRDAMCAINDHAEIGYILVSMKDPLTEDQRRAARDNLHILESQSSNEDQILKGMEMFLEHCT